MSARRILLLVAAALGLAFVAGSAWYLVFSTPTSPMSKIIALAVRAMDVKSATLARLRSGGDFADPLTYEPVPDAAFVSKYRVTTTSVAGRTVFAINPPGGTARHTIFYLHGGAYAAGFTAIYWPFLGWLADQAGATVVAPDYPIAPAATWRTGFPMVKAAYLEAAARAGMGGISLMGDSAGGGLALALAQDLAASGIPQPDRIILLSPWLDITLSNPEIARHETRDPILSVAALRMVGSQWAGGDAPNDWHLSPLNGEFADLARLSIFSGTSDILYPDARALHGLLDAHSIRHDWFEYPDMLHVWMLLELPEADQARGQIIGLFPNPIP